jgi:hypothetical protein
MDKEKNRPCFEKKVGAIRLVVFENFGDNGKPWHNISITRSYRQGTEWKEATTFNGEGDLAQVGWAVFSALEWLRTRQNGGVNHENGDE